MALIICPKCGIKISDNSTHCIHCGATIVKYQTCKECGNKYPAQEKICPNCGSPSKKTASTFYSSEREKEVDLFLLTNTEYYPIELYNEVKSWMMSLSEKQLFLIYNMNYRDATIMLLVSIFLGYIGLDRILLKDTKKGLMKLALTCCSFLVIPGLIALGWWIKDIINIKEMVKEYNYNEMKKVARID